METDMVCVGNEPFTKNVYIWFIDNDWSHCHIDTQ